jgi:hypothetical protein
MKTNKKTMKNSSPCVGVFRKTYPNSAPNPSRRPESKNLKAFHISLLSNATLTGVHLREF